MAKRKTADRPQVLAFLRAIKETPEDDTPRLILADWLDENGDPDRAEFIRVQCRLARLAEDAAEREPLEQRERALLEQHAAAWSELFTGPGVEATFERGLLAVTRQPERFLTRRRQQQAGSEAWAWVSSLDVRSWFSPEQATAFAASPALAHLTGLRLPLRYDSGAEHLRILGTSPHLSGLTALKLVSNNITPKGGVALAESFRLPRLTTLDLKECKIGDEGLEALAESPLLDNVATLNLWYSNIGERGACALAASTHVQHLRTLDISINDIGDRGAAALFRSPRLAALTELDLEHNGFGRPATTSAPPTARRCISTSATGEPIEGTQARGAGGALPDTVAKWRSCPFRGVTPLLPRYCVTGQLRHRGRLDDCLTSS